MFKRRNIHCIGTHRQRRHPSIDQSICRGDYRQMNRTRKHGCIKWGGHFFLSSPRAGWRLEERNPSSELSLRLAFNSDDWNQQDWQLEDRRESRNTLILPANQYHQQASIEREWHLEINKIKRLIIQPPGQVLHSQRRIRVHRISTAHQPMNQSTHSQSDRTQSRRAGCCLREITIPFKRCSCSMVVFQRQRRQPALDESLSTWKQRRPFIPEDWTTTPTLIPLPSKKRNIAEILIRYLFPDTTFSLRLTHTTTTPLWT